MAAALAAALALAAGPARANNLLVNPGFEGDSGHVVASGWTYFSDPAPPGYFGDYWVETRAGIPHSGAQYWKQWGALYNATNNNVAGIYQEFSSASGSIYEANGWIYTSSSDLLGADCSVWLEVSFLDASGKLLALYKSDDFSASTGADTWFPYQVTNACDLSRPVSVGDPYFTTYAVTCTVSQLVAPPGTATIRYRFDYLQVTNEGGSCYLDDTVLDQVSGTLPPVISDVSPLNMIFVNPNDGLTFDATSPSGTDIENTNIGLVVNGQDVSSKLQISGSSSDKTVSYLGLQSNSTYTASITVTDAFGFTASANTYFETTWVGTPPVVYLWEAEDFDFDNGMHIDNPDLCNAPGDPNCYFGKVGVEGVDEHSLGSGGDHLYRPDDAIPTHVAGDYLRPNLVAAGRLDYRIDPFQSEEWLNYTRDWTNGTFWVIARVATGEGLSGSLTLSEVGADGTATNLGAFSVASGLGWTTFENVLLRDSDGNIVPVTLNGKATLRVTSGGNLLPNFFALVAGQIDLPVVKNMYPTGSHPFEYTNAFSFDVSSLGATIAPQAIRVSMDGVDVSSSLAISGSDSNRNVLYPALQPNALHTAIIDVTNSLTHGVSLTNHFDTFSQTNYMVEAEDFDYDGGRYVTNWFPDAYLGFGATTNIDFQHTPIAGEQFPYRANGIPEEIAYDYLRQAFVDVGATDYHLAWFGPGDWANYTRGYPTGSFLAYIRSAGFGAYTMNLDEVTSGAGTVSEVTTPLGAWNGLGRDNQTHAWVLLTDPTNGAPAVVKLDGQATLRLSTPTGDCYPNYFMFVPAATLPSGLRLSAAFSSGNILLSFPTQSGLSYQVLYRNNLTTGSWQTLTTVPGDGTTHTVTDAPTTSGRFYRLQAQQVSVP